LTLYILEIKIKEESDEKYATTGFHWTAQANIADTSVLAQTAHQYIEPRVNGSEKPVSGMAGIEEWTFRANQKGTTTVRLSYDRPWEGGEKAPGHLN
jgi:predicted secreted protein